MSPVVLDASAVLAALAGEPGADIVNAVLPNAVISAVNLTEVGAKLAERGMTEADIRTAVGLLGLNVATFDEDAAYAAAMLRVRTRGLGLSLGDRVCLALGVARSAPVLTADRTWARLDVGADVRLIRGNA